MLAADSKLKVTTASQFDNCRRLCAEVSAGEALAQATLLHAQLPAVPLVPGDYQLLRCLQCMVKDLGFSPNVVIYTGRARRTNWEYDTAVLSAPPVSLCVTIHLTRATLKRGHTCYLLPIEGTVLGLHNHTTRYTRVPRSALQSPEVAFCVQLWHHVRRQKHIWSKLRFFCAFPSGSGAVGPAEWSQLHRSCRQITQPRWKLPRQRRLLGMLGLKARQWRRNSSWIQGPR